MLESICAFVHAHTKTLNDLLRFVHPGVKIKIKDFLILSVHMFAEKTVTSCLLFPSSVLW